MARLLCFLFVTICTVVLMVTRSSAQNCYEAPICIADSYSASRCGERTVSCSNSQGCISASSTATIGGIKRTGWEKECAQSYCPATPTCGTVTIDGVKTRTCIACCRGNLCNTGSPPSSSSVTFPFSPLVMSLLSATVVFMMK